MIEPRWNNVGGFEKCALIGGTGCFRFRDGHRIEKMRRIISIGNDVRYNVGKKMKFSDNLLR